MDNTPSVEAGFRESLQDLQAVITALLPLCPTTGELLESVKLAVENDTHLALVMGIVRLASVKKR